MKKTIVRFLKRLPSWIWSNLMEFSPFALNFAGCIVFAVSALMSGAVSRLITLCVAVLVWGAALELHRRRSEAKLLREIIAEMTLRKKALDASARDSVEGTYKDLA